MQLNYIKNPRSIGLSLLYKYGHGLTDALYLRILFYLKTGKRLNLKNPKTFNEKCQWLKLYNRKPEYTTMVDKYAVKNYVTDKIGEQYIIPTLGVWEKPESIDWNSLPKQFVIKTTNGGGSKGVVICVDKATFDVESATQNLRVALKRDIYKRFKEWPYKDVKPRIIAEKYLEDKDQLSLVDYKVLCFCGKAKLIELHNGRNTDHHTQDFYDRDWNKTSITQGGYGEFSDSVADRPAQLEEMLRLSEILAKDIPHVRVDWYIVDNHLYFGELTFFDGSGLEPWDRDEDDLLLGSWITLPELKR